MTLVTLVAGGRPSDREAMIAASIIPGQSTAVILEGLPDGNSPHGSLQQAATCFAEPQGRSGNSSLRIARIAPGCPCCSGNLTMRITLNRLLRHSPDRLYIGLATSIHLEQVRSFLSIAPYDSLLTLTQDQLLHWHG